VDNGYYDFSFWGFDGIDFSSNGALFSTFNGGNSMFFNDLGNSVSTIGVTSLRGWGQAANNTAERSTYNYSNPEPSILWTWQFNREVSKIKVFEQNFEAKISYYNPGEGHKPVGLPIHTETSPIRAEGALTLRSSDNEALPGGPYRDLDIVVEAKQQGNEATSSNGFKENEGYDILGIRNSFPETLNLSELDPNFQKVGFNVALYFSFKNFEVTAARECYRGWIVVLSKESFTANEVRMNGGDFDIQMEAFYDRRALNKIYAVTTQNSSSVYAGIVLLDEFDMKFIKSRTVGFGEIVAGRPLQDKYLEEKVFTLERMPDVIQIDKLTVN